MKKVFLMIAAAMFMLSGCAESVSIGVIGGADGPTAVFVSAAPFWWVPFVLIAAVVAAVIIGIARRQKK